MIDTWKFKEKGFTLFEVLVSLAIIGIALVLILESFSLSLKTSSESRNISLATLLANDKMVEIETEGFPETGEENGVFEPPYSDFRWIKSVEDLEIEGVRRAVVGVYWKDEKHDDGVTLETFMVKK
ncbi:MAG: prepilin-type N-terminal cleavage/methylation domain-containing protein [Thermodesulfobacteriota bacterium]|nr:prepilin-type N-terminal cleavage/methylation domain-containing protein [Thermodesulfobacteriota bacterium]